MTARKGHNSKVRVTSFSYLIYFSPYPYAADPTVVKMQARIARLQERGERASAITSAVASRCRQVSRANETSGTRQGKRKAAVSMTGSTSTRVRGSSSTASGSGVRGRARTLAPRGTTSMSESRVAPRSVGTQRAESSSMGMGASCVSVNTFARDIDQSHAAPGPSGLGT